MTERTGDPSATVQAQARQLFQDLSDETLGDFAGDKVFARGKTYAAMGAVQDVEDDEVNAAVRRADSSLSSDNEGP